MKTLFALLALFTMSAHAIDFNSAPASDADWTAFLDAVAQVESGGKTGVSITDVNGKKSVGCLQIQQPYLTDSRLSYTLSEMTDKVKAYAVAKAYLQRYAKNYKRVTGKDATFEVLARIHNGGPTGWSKAATVAYANKVKAKLQ